MNALALFQESCKHEHTNINVHTNIGFPIFSETQPGISGEESLRVSAPHEPWILIMASQPGSEIEYALVLRF